MNNIYRHVITQTRNADLEKIVYSHVKKLKERNLVWVCAVGSKYLNQKPSRGESHHVTLHKTEKLTQQYKHIFGLF